jgi:transcriptional regulator with XRE-family HTH domain
MLSDMPYQRPQDERDDRILRRFGLELRRCRLSAGLSQMVLSDRSGVSQSTISRLENGKAASAAMFKLVRLSDAMGGGLPLAFCPHDHACAWQGLDEDGRLRPHHRRGDHASDDPLGRFINSAAPVD